MFANCQALTSLNLSKWNVSQVTDLGYMFSTCYSLTSIGDVSSWDTSKVTQMNYVFYQCHKLTVICSNWNVANVTSHSNFALSATGVTLPLAWQASGNSLGFGERSILLSSAPCADSSQGDADVTDEDLQDDGAREEDASGAVDGAVSEQANSAVNNQAAAQTGNLSAAS